MTGGGGGGVGIPPPEDAFVTGTGVRLSEGLDCESAPAGAAPDPPAASGVMIWGNSGFFTDHLYSQIGHSYFFVLRIFTERASAQTGSQQPCRHGGITFGMQIVFWSISKQVLSSVPSLTSSSQYSIGGATNSPWQEGHSTHSLPPRHFRQECFLPQLHCGAASSAAVATKTETNASIALIRDMFLIHLRFTICSLFENELSIAGPTGQCSHSGGVS
jgi:hypothetical protein